MARFLFAWELGGGLGHVMPLAQIARPLLERGHEVHLVLRDLSSTSAVLSQQVDSPLLRLWQAPIWLPAPQGLPPAASYAELLLQAGYLDAKRLLGLVRAWRSLLRAITPDLLLVDHAPTALLAARGLLLRRMVLGSGFFVPPALTPMPGFREWEALDARRLAQSEAQALVSCNAVLASDGLPPMAALRELTDADEQVLLTWPELDHYGQGASGRPGARYWGGLSAPDRGAAAVWPEGVGEPLFAYLKADYPAIEPLLLLLSKAPFRTLAHIAGLSAAQRKRYASARLRFSEGALSMRSVLVGARAVLCHAGSGTVLSALRAGLPVLALPMQAEQLLMARRITACRAGALLMGGDLNERLVLTLAELLANTGPRLMARALAARHAPKPGDGNAPNVAERVAERCLCWVSQELAIDCRKP